MNKFVVYEDSLRRVLVAAIILASLVLAACTPDDSNVSDEPRPSATLISSSVPSTS